VAQFQEHDPIGRLEKHLRAAGALDDKKVQAINDEIHKQVEEAHIRADNDPYPELDDVWTDIYANPFDPYKL